MGEPVASVLDNLDRAQRLGLLDQPAEHWLTVRALRNRTVREYIRDQEVLADAVNAAHQVMPMPVQFVAACHGYFWTGCVIRLRSPCQPTSVCSAWLSIHLPSDRHLAGRARW